MRAAGLPGEAVAPYFEGWDVCRLGTCARAGPPHKHMSAHWMSEQIEDT
jgi:hypothetical protein